MDPFTLYTVSTSGWLTLQSIPLLFTPSILLPLFTPDESHASALAVYLGRSVALTSLTLAACTLLLSGLLPLGPPSEADNATLKVFSTPVTVTTTIFHFAAAFHAYTTFASGGGTIYMFGVVGSGTLAAMGTWCALFADDKGHISRRTGKDKRVSGFPFGDRKGRATELKEQ